MTANAHELLAPDNEAELQALVRMLRRADGFALAFAIVNHPRLLRRLADEARARAAVEPVVEVVLDPDRLEGVVGQIERAVGDATPAAVFAFGLERLVVLTKARSPALDLLNLNRDYAWKRFPCPVVFWVPEFVVREFARQAPDFWSGRSGVYRFVGDDAAARETVGELGLDLDWSAPLAARREQAETLRSILEELDEAGGGQPATRGVLLARLAVVTALQSEWATAERAHRQMLAVFQKVGNWRGEAESLSGLGSVARLQGRYDEAEGYHRQALAIYREVGDRLGEANCLLGLGGLPPPRTAMTRWTTTSIGHWRSTETSTFAGARPTACSG